MDRSVREAFAERLERPRTGQPPRAAPPDLHEVKLRGVGCRSAHRVEEGASPVPVLAV